MEEGGHDNVLPKVGCRCLEQLERIEVVASAYETDAQRAKSVVVQVPVVVVVSTILKKEKIISLGSPGSAGEWNLYKLTRQHDHALFLVWDRGVYTTHGTRITVFHFHIQTVRIILLSNISTTSRCSGCHGCRFGCLAKSLANLAINSNPQWRRKRAVC